ncbi:hypothetical protein [Heyndrickxia vini]|uniref:Uncharacterized protein n=1 Tax=Heyndrickxia vini TaxID=1476025 RepID=A0ABX7DXF9_9BACI|nr:hypothetical protein [Heyndrickxia vini]QQZ07631.1 hypothetical protein I5776_11000 [Heyndrickxia vini]
MGFRTMLIGFIFVFFNINFGEVNLLPDLLGYIIILIGAYTLIGNFKNGSFLKVLHSSIILIVLSGLDLFIKHSIVLNGVINNSTILHGKVFLILFYLINTLLITYCLYQLCKGIEQEATNKENNELQERSKKTFIVFAIYEACFFLFMLVGILSGDQTTTFNSGWVSILFWIGLIIVIFVFSRLFLLLNNAEKTFKRL